MGNQWVFSVLVRTEKFNYSGQINEMESGVFSTT
jgi:hypothetical protein